MEDTSDLPPMAAGLFGYFGYDAVRQIETIPDQNASAIDMDDSRYCALPLRYLTAGDGITCDADRPLDGKMPKRLGSGAYGYQCDKQSENPCRIPRLRTATLPEPIANMSKSSFLDMVKKARLYPCHDIFQIVLFKDFLFLFTCQLSIPQVFAAAKSVTFPVLF